jgi:mannose-6-phosphate isomerase-like protein (cupin superfamily)
METIEKRSKRILGLLNEKYPDAKAYDLDGRGMHFVCEVEPVSEHPEYDRAVEVIISSRPHKHLKMTQWYTILQGTLELHRDKKVETLNTGDKTTILPGEVHWAESDGACWVEILSKPGWTAADHIVT